MAFRLAAVFFALFVVGSHAACTGSVRYMVSNVCTWTSRTHPTDYPENAHFSPMCGTVHNDGYTLFYEGGTSTPGVQEVAETGMCTLLEGEIADCVTNGDCAMGGSFSWPCDTSRNEEGVGDGVCTHSGTVTVSESYPYVSMISMIAPSPDWFVGLSGVNLCKTDDNGESYWVDQYPEEMPANLYAYDAGTDSGETFMSENEATNPFEPITEFLARDSSNIFYNQDTNMLNPLCMTILVKE